MRVSERGREGEAGRVRARETEREREMRSLKCSLAFTLREALSCIHTPQSISHVIELRCMTRAPYFLSTRVAKLSTRGRVGPIPALF